MEGPKNYPDPESATIQVDLDVSQIQLDEVEICNGTLISMPSLVLHPELDYADDDHDHKHPVMVVRDPELNIDVWGYSQDELIETIEAQLDSLWSNFALADNSELTVGAVAVKNALKLRFQFQKRHAI